MLTQYFDGLEYLRRGAKDLSGPSTRVGRLDTGLSRGDRLGEYEIVREVGRGGMGVVYEAWQPSLNRRVAVKVLPTGFAADRTRLRRFAVEAQAAAAVDHPHIVPVYAIGEDQGINYYVMRLVNGVSLDALIAGMMATATIGLSTDEATGSHAASGSPQFDTRRPGADGRQSDRFAPNLATADRAVYHRAVARRCDVARRLTTPIRAGLSTGM